MTTHKVTYDADPFEPDDWEDPVVKGGVAVARCSCGWGRVGTHDYRSDPDSWRTWDKMAEYLFAIASDYAREEHPSTDSRRVVVCRLCAKLRPHPAAHTFPRR